MDQDRQDDNSGAGGSAADSPSSAEQKKRGARESSGASEASETDEERPAEEESSEQAGEARADDGTDGAEDQGPAEEADPQDTVSENLRSLEKMLRQTRSSRRLKVLAEGVFWYGAGLSAVLMSALLIAVLFPAAAPGMTRWLLMIGAGAATLVGAVALGGFLRESDELGHVARGLQRADASFRNDIVAALEFGRTMLANPEASDAELGFSRFLGRAHLKRTVEGVRQRAEGGHLAHLLPDRTLEPPLFAMVGGMALVTLSVVMAPELTLRVLRSPIETAAGAQEDQKVVQPIVGNLQLHYSAPRYTGRGERTEPFSSGHIEAIVGSEVTLSAQPLLDQWETLEMVVETGEGGRTVALEDPGNGRVRADLVVTRSGHYQFRAVRKDGTVITDGMKREIEVVADDAPNVTITSHEGEVEVSPEDVLEIEYSVSDDFGVAAVERVYHFAGDQSSKKSRELKPARLQNGAAETVDGTLKFDLRPLALRPKDTVIFYLKATDNNSLTGPGVAKSTPLVLTVSSPEDKHLELIQKQQEISEKLLSLLADYLENPMGQREVLSDGSYTQNVAADASPTVLAERFHRLKRIHNREEKLLGAMKELVAKMEEDPLMVERDLSLFEGLHKHLTKLHERGSRLYSRVGGQGRPEELGLASAGRVADYVGEVEDTLEKSMLQLMELIASQKMDAIKATREDITKLKERLKELLKKYKESKDPELKKAIKREMQRLRQRMAELMSRMQMQIRKLPKEHLNEKALKQQQLESETRQMSDSLKSMEQQLEEGDIDGAIKALEQMESKLNSMGSKMDQQFANAQPQGLSKLDKEMSEMMNKVNDLQAAEKELEKQTRELQREQAEARRKQIEQMLEEFTQKMEQRVDRQMKSLERLERRDLPNHELSGLEANRKHLENLKEALKHKDMKQALEAARDSVENLETLRFNLGLSKRHARSGSKRSQAVDRSYEDVRQMVPRGQKIREEIEQLMERARQRRNSGQSQQMQKLAERQRKVRRQAEKLGQKIQKSGEEYPMLKQQLGPSLKGAQKDMKNAEQRLKKGQGQGALDSERSALEQLGKLKNQMKRTMQKQRQKQKGEGGQGQRKDKVEIPGESDGAKRQQLRDEVMDAMKEGKIENYEKEIEDYYKSLVE